LFHGCFVFGLILVAKPLPNGEHTFDLILLPGFCPSVFNLMGRSFTRISCLGACFVIGKALKVWSPAPPLNAFFIPGRTH